MSDKVLVDTNLWVYLYAKSPETKYFKVKQLIEKNFDNIVFNLQSKNYLDFDIKQKIRIIYIGEQIMSKTIEAIFENGVFKPISFPDISEHKKVTLIIEDKEPFDILSLASMVYNGLSPEDIEDIEKLATDRSRFSRNRN